MERTLLAHLPECNADPRDEPSHFRIVERAEIDATDGAKYQIYVIGIKSRSGFVDVVHAISSKNGHGHLGLKFCPMENINHYTVLQNGRTI